MQPAKQIDDQPTWMTDQSSVDVMNALGGFETNPDALFVGGCVRNMLLGMPVADIDIATRHHPLVVIEKLKKAGIRYDVPTGLEHGTVTAIIGDATFEITSLRKDVETDGRRAVIAFSDRWEEDAERRDFTINTLLASPEGLIYDPTGLGLKDLEAGYVRFVGDPTVRIQEDYLRILRFFRFYARYGRGDPDKSAISACKQAASKIAALSKERVTQEIIKIMMVPDPSAVVGLMVASNVMPCVGKRFREEAFQDFCKLQTRHDATDIMARLFMADDMDAGCFQSALVLSNADKKILETLEDGMKILSRISKIKIRELVYRIGNKMALQVYFLRLAQNEDLPDLDLLDIARYWQAPEFPIKAEELIEAGIARGPALGKKLKALEEKWISKDFPTDFAYKK